VAAAVVAWRLAKSLYDSADMRKAGGRPEAGGWRKDENKTTNQEERPFTHGVANIYGGKWCNRRRK
jgi:hypothetical protein